LYNSFFVDAFFLSLRFSIFNFKIENLFTRFPTTQKVQAIQYNEQLNLHCPVDGVPTPQKIWHKKQHNETIELPFTENVEIKEFKSHDEGIYICEAKNQIGVSKEIKYHVTGRADGEFSIIMQKCFFDYFLFFLIP